MKNTLLTKKLIIWFIISEIIIIGGGIVDKASGTEGTGGVNALGMGIGIFIEAIILVILLKNIIDIQDFMQQLFKKLWLRSVFVGWFFAMIAEIIFYPTNPLSPGISLFGDLILTTPPYIFAHYFWYRVLNKYKFSIKKSFCIGGGSILIMEFIFGGMINPIIIPIAFALYPSLALMHGFHMIMPRLVSDKDLSGPEQKYSKKAYFLAIVYPIIGILIGIIISGLLFLIFKIT